MVIAAVATVCVSRPALMVRTRLAARSRPVFRKLGAALISRKGHLHKQHPQQLRQWSSPPQTVGRRIFGGKTFGAVAAIEG
jgi:hypothetical protein